MVQEKSVSRRRRRLEEKPQHHSRIPHRHRKRSQDFPGRERPSQAGSVDAKEEQHDRVAEEERLLQVEEAAKEQAVFRNQETELFWILDEEEARYLGS